MNITGGSGVIAADYAYKQPADGYTFILGTQSLFILDIQHALSMNFREEFIPVARLVHATNIIAASKRFMDRNGFKAFSNIIKYVKDHPYRVKAGMFTSTGVDGISLKETLKGLSVLDSLSEAIAKAVQDTKWQEFLVEGSYDERAGFAGPSEYSADCEKDYKLLTDYLNTEGIMNNKMKDY